MPSHSIESRALRLSPLGYLVFGALGIGFFFLTHSEAILLDGVYSLISLVLALLALRVSKLVGLPGSTRYHFGHAQLEPLINTVRVAVILGVDAFALSSAVAALFDGGRDLITGPAVIYGGLSAASCLAMSAYQKRAARLADSPILKVDARNWLVDGIISSGVGISFVIAYFIERSAHAAWVPYIDPILVVLLVTATLPVTLTSLRENFPELLHAAPPVDTQRLVREKVGEQLEGFDHRNHSVRMLQMGRVFYAMIHVVVSKDTQSLDIEDCDRIRRRIEESMAALHPRPVVDVIFTADESTLLVP